MVFTPLSSPVSGGQKPSLPVKKEFFESPRPSLAKEGSTAFPKPLFPQGTGDVTALRCSEPLRYKVGGPSKVSPGCAGWDCWTVAGDCLIDL